MRTLLILLAFSGVAAGQDVWTLRHEAGGYPAIVAGRPGLYLVGTDLREESGYRFAASNDGINWRQTTLPYADSTTTIGDTVIGASAVGVWSTQDGAIYNWSLPGTYLRDPRIATGSDCIVVGTDSGEIYRAVSEAGPWIKQLSPADSITGLAFGNGFFLASTRAGYCIKSNDGISWVQIGGQRNDVIYFFGNGSFISEDARTSDGLTWITGGLPEDGQGRGAAGPGVFVNCTDLGFYTSVNGSIWGFKASGISGEIMKVGFCGDMWIACTAGGRIITSPVAGATPLAPPPLQVKPAMEITWPSIIGRRYQVQGSSDNQQWGDIGLPLNGDGSDLKFTAPANTPKQFFRVNVR